MKILKQLSNASMVIMIVSTILYLALYLFNETLSDLFAFEGVIFAVIGLITYKVVEYATR